MLFFSIAAGRRRPERFEVHLLDRNPFGKAAAYPSALRGTGGEATMKRTDEPQRRRTRAVRRKGT